MSRRLTQEEYEQKIIENMNLVYHQIKKLPHANLNNYDDLVQMGRIGLIKAVSTFDEEKEIKFATYAVTCINNEIYTYFRKERPHNSEMSINDIIRTNERGEEVELEEILGNEDEFVDEIEDESLIINVLNIILNILKPKEAIAILCEISGMYTQIETGKFIGVSQSYVSRLRETVKRNIREYLESEERLYYPAFSIMKVGNFYKFSCNTKQSRECLEKFLQEKKSEKLLDCQIIKDDERIELWMPSYPETFVFIAEFIKENSNV